MARIHRYTKGNVTLSDTLIGTDVENQKTTVNIPISAIVDLITPYNDTNPNGPTPFAEPGIFSGGGTPTLATGVTAEEIRNLIGAGTVIVANDTGLAIDNNILSTTYNTTMLDGVRSTATGGAEPALASDWKKKSIVEVLDTILFPTTQASVSAPASATLTNSNTATKVEVGTIKENVLTATFDRGKIENGDGSVGPDLVGPATNYKFEGTGITSPINQTNNNDLTVSTEIVDGDNEWKVTISHDVGTGDYFDNKNEVGDNLVEQRSVGSKVGYTPTVTGAYKQFYGPSASLVTTSAGVRSLPSSRFNVTGSFETVGFSEVNFIIAIPATATLSNVVSESNDPLLSEFESGLQQFLVNDANNGSIMYKVYTFTSTVPNLAKAIVTITK